ncbi:uncharacterized protein [Musca autumnalis]|uniref:uncharacterized protein n=1 Tax=Musca autumnalis TaxID=221902 RepID=UPI003CEC1F61
MLNYSIILLDNECCHPNFEYSGRNNSISNHIIRPLDCQLRWNRNAEERAKRGWIALYSCKNSIGKSWGLNPSIIHWLYNTVIRPILSDGSLVWWHSMRQKSTSGRLDKVKRAASILITGATRSTPQDALNAMLNLKPLSLSIKCQATRSALRLHEQDLWRGCTYGHGCILNESGINVNQRGKLSDYISPVLRFDDIDVVIPSRDDWNRSNTPLDGLAFYTDGSKMEEGTGAGVYCEMLSLEYTYRLDSNCSVFQAEIFAIWKAAKLIKSLDAEIFEPVTIFVDSQAALKAIKSCNIKSDVVLKCRSALETLTNGFRLCWVPGHRDYLGNERADKLARRGSQSTDLAIADSIKPPICHFFQKIETFSDERASELWHNEPRCIVARSIWPSVSQKNELSVEPEYWTLLYQGTYHQI